MPDEVLTRDDDARPVAGFFGKLPSTGDFVWRGLPDAFRKHWDFWLTRHVATLNRAGLAVPSGGLRFRLPSGGRLVGGVIVDGHDRVGRHFPLSLLLVADGDLSPQEIDPWCDAALSLAPDTLSADDLWHALDALPAPVPHAAASGPMQLWIPGHAPLPTDAEDPEATLKSLLIR